MVKVSAQTFSSATWKKSEINMRLSDLHDNLHTVLRFYKNNYTVSMAQEQILSKESTAADRNNTTIFSFQTSSFFIALRSSCSWIF